MTEPTPIDSLATGALAGSPFPSEFEIQIRRNLTIGELGAADSLYVFGAVADGAILSDGTIVVADPRFARIVVFDSSGQHRRFIGARGAGPGEMLQPTGLVSVEDLIVAFDHQLGRFTVFDTAGNYLSDFKATMGSINQIAKGPGRTILVAAADTEGPLFHLIDLQGKQIASFPHRTSIPGSELQRSRIPVGGAACTLSDESVLLANPLLRRTNCAGRGT